MDIDALFFSFYLLFPTFNTSQEALVSSVTGKNSLTKETRESVCAEMKNFLSIYDSYFDIDFPVFVDDAPGESPAEVQYLDSMKRLRLFEFGEEFFLSQKLPSQGPVMVRGNGETFSISSYDDFYRLKEKTLWKNSEKAADSIMLDRRTYNYKPSEEGDSVQLMLLSMQEEDFKNKLLIKVYYDDKGNPVFFNYYKNDKEDKENGKLVKKRSCVYDEEKRLVEEEEVVYFQVPDPLRRGKTKDSFSSRKNIYTYTEVSAFPDYIFYEDGKLRIRVSYSGEEDFTEESFFEGGISLKSVFKNGIKVEEIIKSGENKESRRSF